MLDHPDPYEKYGLTRVINAATSLTMLGGSMPHPSVFQAMHEASKAFIHIPTLQAWAGERLSQALGGEAGLPTAGASNGLMLACAACIFRESELAQFDPLDEPKWTHIVQRLPLHTEGLPTQFIVMADSRSTYDYAIEATGGKRVEAGEKDSVEISDLESAFQEGETAAYYYTLYPFKRQAPLEEVAKLAHEKGVPIIVDAAPCLTHKGVPKWILGKGADLVVFSGGKQLGGPNNTGILLGKRELVKLAHLNAYPFDGIGRAAKMSRETIMGLIQALEIFMERDDNLYYSKLLEETQRFSGEVNQIPGLRSGVLIEPSVLPGATPPSYAWVEVETPNLTARELYLRLLKGKPSIRALFEPYFITTQAANRLTFKMEYLLPGDKEAVLRRLREEVTPCQRA